MNEKRRIGGFSPDPRDPGGQPRQADIEQGDDELAGQVGSLEERAGPTTIFAERDGIEAPGEESVHAVRLIATNRKSIATQSCTRHWRVLGWRFGILSIDKKEHGAYDATYGHLPHESFSKSMFGCVRGNARLHSGRSVEASNRCGLARLSVLTWMRRTNTSRTAAIVH